MSTLQVANIHLESTANSRIQYTGSQSFGLYAGGVSALTVNSTAMSDSKGNIRDIPVNNQTTTYTTVSDDNGKTITTTANVTVNGAIFSNGQAVSIYNNSASNITILPGTGVTMYLAGTATTGNRTLAQRGVCTALMVSTNVFVITGGGLT